MSKQKKIRRADHYYDERIEEADVQAISKDPSKTIFERAAKKPWKWIEHLKIRMKIF